MTICRKENIYYLVTKSELSFSKLKASFWDLHSPLKEPTFSLLKDYEESLMIYKRQTDGLEFYVIPFSFSFSDAMVGLDFYNHAEFNNLTQFDGTNHIGEYIEIEQFTPIN